MGEAGHGIPLAYESLNDVKAVFAPGGDSERAYWLTGESRVHFRCLMSELKASQTSVRTVTGITPVDEKTCPELFARSRMRTLIIGTNVIKESLTIPVIKVTWDFQLRGGQIDAPCQGWTTVLSFQQSEGDFIVCVF